MGRKKRSEKAGAVAVAAERPAPRRKPAPVTIPTAESLQAFCPVCGKMCVDRQAGGVLAPRTVPYFESIDWDPDKPFGMAKSIAGRGSFRDWRYIDPEEAPELFGGMKARFLQAMREWLAKGWIGQDEVRQLISEPE